MEPLTAIVQSAIRTILHQGPMSHGKLKLAWRVAVGPAMDRATTVALLDDGTIEVAAADAAWRREVRRSQAMILSRLLALIGEQSPTKLRIVTAASEK